MKKISDFVYKPGTIVTYTRGEQLSVLTIGSIFIKDGDKYEVTHTGVINGNNRRYLHTGRYAKDITLSSYGYARKLGTDKEIGMSWGNLEEKDIIHIENLDVL